MIHFLRMKRHTTLMLSVSFILVQVFTSCVPAVNHSAVSNRIRPFNADWRFTRDSVLGAELPGFNDSRWRTLDLPHDWSIEDAPEQIPGKSVGPFSKESPGGMATGHVLGGTGWNRKTFSMDANDENKLVSVYFEGAYMETDVWINGNHLGTHPYGYTSFRYDITKFCKAAGQQNVIAVRVVNKGKNSRWYSGSGIYRPVWLTVTNPVHIEPWGIYITTPNISNREATVKISTTVLSPENRKEDIRVGIVLFDAEGNPVGSSESRLRAVNGKTIISQDIPVISPRLWSTDSPYLYRAEVRVLKG